MILNSRFHIFGVEIGDYRDNYSAIVLVNPKNVPKLKLPFEGKIKYFEITSVHL